jgi:hypothetical protein
MRATHLLAAVLACALAAGSPPASAADSKREAATQAMLSAESLGELRLDLPEKRVLELLGKPGKQGKLILQGADGMHVQEWHYPKQGLHLVMSAGEKKTGAKTVFNFTASAPCSFATKQGLKIGSPESAVRKAYGPFLDRDSPAEPGSFVAGSIYGGIIFHFAKGKVSRIFFGAAAE